MFAGASATSSARARKSYVNQRQDGGDDAMSRTAFPFFPIQLKPEMGRQSLYMSGPFPMLADDGVLIEPGQELLFDGAMNSLYDRELLPFAGNKRLVLGLDVQGACAATLFHRTPDGQQVDHGKRLSPRDIRTDLSVDGDDGELHRIEIDFKLMTSEQSFGRWFFTVASLGLEAKLVSAAWYIVDAELDDISPSFVICTFKRETQVTANVRGLVELFEPTTSSPEAMHPDVADYGILVVDNARTLAQSAFPSSKVRLVHQRNVGGAGGFGRGIHEALQAGSAFTHVILLDDDADIDALSITRMINLLRLSRDPNLFVGGLQFDTYNPVQLADAGTYWRPERFERPIGRIDPCDAGTVAAQDALARAYNINFNGWWLFGARVEAFRTFGMPLPCFVHLDDVEFGVRVHLKGGRTISVPGIAVWHEPFYAKVEGWFAYYNIRNELIRLSSQLPLVLAHTSDRPASVLARLAQTRVVGVSKQLRSRFRDFVNSYQYGSALLLTKAIEDFLLGATLIRDKDAEALHAEVMTEYQQANRNYRLARTLPPGLVADPPSRGKKLYRLAQIYSRNGSRFRISVGGDASRIAMFPSRREINWKSIRARQAWGYPDPASSSYHIYKFDRDIYTEVNARFRKAIREFDRKAGQAQVSWSESYSELISHDYWANLVKSF